MTQQDPAAPPPQPPAWFPTSKRFWATLVTPIVAGALAQMPAVNDFIVRVADACCQIPADQATAWAAAVATGAVVGFIGMKWGQRAVTVLPPNQPH